MAGRRKVSTESDGTATPGEVEPVKAAAKPKAPRKKSAKAAATADDDAKPATEAGNDSDGDDEMEAEPEALDAELVDRAGELPIDGDDDDVPRRRPNDADVEIVDDEIVPPRGRGAGKTDGRSLTRLDPLTLYLNDVRRYPLLTREEEHDLASKFVQTGDVEAARRLVTSNLRLVVKIAHEYQRAHRNLLDLVQEGNVGLMQAVKKYDPYRGVKLSSYAAWWIRAYILKFILNNWRLVKIGTTQAQRKLFFNLRKEREKLEREGFVATSKAIAEALNVPEREVVDMEKRLGAGELSLDAPVSAADEMGRTHMDTMESLNEERPDVAAEGREFRDLLKDKLATFEKTLRGREITIFQERLINDQPKTLQEIGDQYGISRERARQLEQRLMAKLKVYLRDELGDAVQIAMGLDE